MTERYYKLEANVIATEEESNLFEKHSFEHIYSIKYLGKVGQNATFYDPELKMNFQDNSALGFRYEIEVVDNHILGSSRLEKSEDFIRRCNFRYDWMQLTVNSNGKVVSIDNEKELEQRWNKLKDSLTKDYKGESVIEYFAEIDTEFQNTNSVWGVASRHLGLGLLFPQIPTSHNKDWSRKRLIEISEYENEKFEEHISYEKTDNDILFYKISGSSLPDNQFRIDVFEGYLSKAANSLLPLEVTISIKYCNDDIQSNWNFKLTKIEE